MKMFRLVAVGVSLVATACATAPAGQAQAPHAAHASATEPGARIAAYLDALSSGDAARFETTAQANLSRELIARRTPAERAQLVQRIVGDFGHIEIIDITQDGDRARAQIRGSNGMNGTFAFEFEDGPEHRIAAVNVEVRMGGGDGGDGSGPRVPPAPLRPDMTPAQLDAALDSWIAPIVSNDDFAGVVLIARHGVPVVTSSYGPADRAHNRAANNATAYNIASIGKRFTQTAVARLIQDGRLSLTSTIGELIPDYPNTEGRAATIDQLVNMRGGIADIFAPERESQPRARFTSNHAYYEFVSSLPQRFAPGSRNEYCNGCYVVLGEIVERLSGMRFEDYVRRQVFLPAGMNSTGYFNTDRLPPNTAISYQRANGPGSAYVDSTNQEGQAGGGAGGLYSTAIDLLAFDNALRDGRLVNAEMSAWVLGGVAVAGRNTSALAIQGGGPGASAVLTSDGRWSVIVTSNVQRPLPFEIADALARSLPL